MLIPNSSLCVPQKGFSFLFLDRQVDVQLCRHPWWNAGLLWQGVLRKQRDSWSCRKLAMERAGVMSWGVVLSDRQTLSFIHSLDTFDFNFDNWSDFEWFFFNNFFFFAKSLLNLERHFENVFASPLDILVEELFQVAKKVVCCVRDNAANRTKAIKSLKYTHTGSFAHTINLTIRAPQGDETAFSTGAQWPHTGLNLLSYRWEAWAEAQRRQCYKCNSSFYVNKLILDFKNAVVCTVAVVNALVIRPVTQDEWEEPQQAGTALEPFEQVTVEISADFLLLSVVWCRE